MSAFDYSVWAPDTVLTLCTVPWDSSYRDLVRFDSEAARAEWFGQREQKGQAIDLAGLVYLRYGEPVSVPLPFSQCCQFNYLVARNPVQPVPSRSEVPPRVPDVFYYFVTDVTYIAPNTTQLNVQLDVWQTYYNRLSFGRSYVTRGHVAVANSNSTRRNMSDYLTDMEGIEYGSEYEVVHQEFITPVATADDVWVLIQSSTNLSASWGTVDKPNLSTAAGGKQNGMVGGADLNAVSMTDFKKLMSALSSAPWVSQGINFITVVPKSLVRVLGSGHTANGGALDIALYDMADSVANPVEWELTDVFAKFAIPQRYSDYVKLNMFPYCLLEVTTLTGNPVTFKPECFDYLGSDTVEFTSRMCPIPPEVKMTFSPQRYNTYGTSNVSFYSCDGTGARAQRSMFGGEDLDMSVDLTDFPQLSLVNNMYQQYLASTVNSRRFEQSAADWSQQKALTAAQNAYNVAQAGMDTSQTAQDISNTLTRAQTNIAQQQNTYSGIKNTAVNAVGAIGSAAGGNLGGAASGLASAAMAGADAYMNAQWIAQSATQGITAANMQLSNTLGYQAYVADTNYTYANYAANGDYQQAIQGIQAKVSDAKLAQPTVSGQVGGASFNWCQGYVGWLVKWKRIKPNYVRQVGDYFMRYGYYVNRFLIPPPDLKCMSKFTYWQLQNAVVFGDVPEVFRQAVRGILEAGATVWTSPDDIGAIDFSENELVQGVSY